MAAGTEIPQLKCGPVAAGGDACLMYALYSCSRQPSFGLTVDMFKRKPSMYSTRKIVAVC